ncbi:purine-nucleoside phosphorylase [Brooklawnia sp.]|uniref:purine-nucleoside phosphorylase n=1 Tax=Brooklawnia sp. TaxID=2699740 RepID=UPI00311FB051
MATPHIAAEPGDFAPAVLMPGDPKRAERIARLLMPDARLVTDVRGMLGFTGTVDGHPLSVMGSGMGQPSITIYATELFSVFGVQRIIRVGTCGAIAPQVKLGDVILATGAHTTSNINQLRLPGMNFSAVASFRLVRAAVDASGPADAGSSGHTHVGMVISDDHFYLPNPDPQWLTKLAQYGVLGVEMEAAALFATAAEFGKEALAVLTASDHLLDQGTGQHGHKMTPAERETRFSGALRLAVAAAFS